MKLKSFILVVFIQTVLWPISYAQKVAYSIIHSQKAGKIEKLAAAEIRKYIYLRTGELFEIKTLKGKQKNQLILIVDSTLTTEEFTLKTNKGNLAISDGTPQAILYGAYEFAEQLGIRFYLDGDVIPDKKIKFDLPVLDIKRKPFFSVRGIQSFHDFPEGPDWWNENDYQAIIGQLPKLKMNFIGFHTYPEQDIPFYVNHPDQGYKAEPLVWIGKESDINPDGTVKAAYPIAHFNTANSQWGYKAKPTSQFSSGASQLFETDGFGADYMKNMSPWPHSDVENIRIFNQTAQSIKKPFELARKIGVKTCVGTESELTIPKSLKFRYGIKAPTDDDIKIIYKGIF